MSESGQRLVMSCASPSCDSVDGTVHEVVSRGGGTVTVRCTDCGYTHKTSPPDQTTVTRDVVVSQEGESFTTTVEAPSSETVRVGEEFVIDNDEVLMAVRITDLQVGPESRVTEAQIADVTTFWTRAVDNVYVNVTVHPADGARDSTRSLEIGVPGDHEFRVGEKASFSNAEFVVTGLVIRDDATGYPARKLDRRGDLAQAKDVKRVYGRDTKTTAWSAW